MRRVLGCTLILLLAGVSLWLIWPERPEASCAQGCGRPAPTESRAARFARVFQE